MKPATPYRPSGRARTAGTWAGVLACIALVSLSPGVARSDERPERHATPPAVVPPGQEELFAAMLGRGSVLPAGCAFVTGQIAGTVVRGVYSCAGGEVVVELRHPSAAPRADGYTEKIGIVRMRGTLPAELLAALQGRIREREGGFEWAWPKPVEAAPNEAAPNEAPPNEAAANEAAPKRSSLAVCASPPGPPGIISPYVPDCYPRFVAVLLGIGQTMVILLGFGCGLVRLYRAS